MASNPIIRSFYKKLLTLYPQAFREQFSESMQQTFNDLYREREARGSSSGFVLWMFTETAVGIFREHWLVITQGDMMKNIVVNPGSAALISSVLLAVAFIVAPLIYLVGNLRDAFGPLSYALADFLSGPVWAASMVTLVFLLRERLGKYAPRRMSLAFMLTLLAATTMVIIACTRSANRQYHLLHPELSLENSSTVLTVWATQIAGLTGAGWHFLGWALLLIGSAGWATRQHPRGLSILYFAGGAISLFVYQVPDLEGLAGFLSMIVGIWQGILLWRDKPQENLINPDHNNIVTKHS